MTPPGWQRYVAALCAYLLLASSFCSCSTHMRHPSAAPLSASELRPDCGNTTHIPYRPGSLRLSLNLTDVPQRCDNTTWGQKLVVAVGRRAETAWMAQHVSVPFIVYHYDEPGAPYTFLNQGNEAMAYLTFVVEHYDCLPEVVLFAHGHRKSNWHSTNELDYNIDRVRWEAVPGFAILRRRGMWYETWLQDTSRNLGGLQEPQRLADAKCEDIINGTSWVFWAALAYWRGERISAAWDTLLQPSGLFGELPEGIQTSITSEFFVTRERIQARPRSFYLQSIAWIKAVVALGPEHGGMTGYDAGVTFENLWATIFGEPAWQDRRLTIPECQLYRCNETELASQHTS